MIQGFSGGLLNRQLIYNLDLPSFQRDFASLKTLNHGTGPNIATTDFRNSQATYFDANGVLQTAAINEPRFDHDPATGSSLGLLIEESRTNSIRNSQAGGSTNGVIGSGGAMPTNWFVGSGSTSNGVSTEVVGTGTESGLAYIDIKISGTPTASGNANNFTDATNIAAATSGQTWTASYYVKLQAGALTNATVSLVTETRNTSNAFVANLPLLTITPTGSALRTQRFSNTGTLSGASVAFVATHLRVAYTSGQQIGGSADGLTLRIAAPQLEQGAFPTSYIPTTNAAATRSADSAVVTPISSFYNQSEGTLFAEATLRGITSGSFPRVVQFDEASSSDNRFNILCTSTPAASAEYRTSGVGQLNTTETAITLGTVFRTVAAVATNNGRVATNGALVGSDDTSLTMNSANTRMRIGTEAGGSFFTGHIRKIAYYPKRLSNTLLQQLTTS